MEALQAIFWGVLTFSILVVMHEGGHFLAARLFGVKVHEFMLGLPGPAARVKIGETQYGVTAIPLGGYVRIAGMEPGEEDVLLADALAVATRAGTIDATELADAIGVDHARASALLYSLADWYAIEPIGEMPAPPNLAKATGDKAVGQVGSAEEVAADSAERAEAAADIQTAGPSAPYEDSDFQLPVEERYRAIYPAEDADRPDKLFRRARNSTYRGLSTTKRVLVLCAGVAVNILAAILVFTVVLSIVGYYKQSLAIEAIVPKSAAANAGIQKGDTITGIGGVPVKDWNQFIQQIAADQPGQKTTITLTRNGVTRTVNVTLGTSPDRTRPFLGVQPQSTLVRPSVFEAFWQSLVWLGLVFAAIGQFFNPHTFKVAISGARSVVGISVEVRDAARAGILSYAGIVGLLSLSLGALNILPIPPLDGGKIALELIERAMGRPISRKITLGLSVAGTLLLFSLIGYLMYADVMRYIVHG